MTAVPRCQTVRHAAALLASGSVQLQGRPGSLLLGYLILAAIGPFLAPFGYAEIGAGRRCRG